MISFPFLILVLLHIESCLSRLILPQVTDLAVYGVPGGPDTKEIEFYKIKKSVSNQVVEKWQLVKKPHEPDEYITGVYSAEGNKMQAGSML
jgi:hypothetical protein